MIKKFIQPYQADSLWIRIILCVTFLFYGGPIANCQETLKQPVSQIESKDTAEISVLFVGDTSFGENYPGTPELLIEKGYDYPLKKVAPLLADTDLIIANLETPITNLEESPLQGAKAYIHHTDVELAPKFFKKYNLKIFSLANNHALDYGIAGLQQTLEVMSQNDLQWFGAGLTEKKAMQPYEKKFLIGGIPFKNVVIGVFEILRNYDRVFNFYAKDFKGGTYGLNPRRLAAQIRSIKKEDPDAYVILFPHWGLNYRWRTNLQTKYAHYLIKSGADLIIGHGGHAMQEIEKYQGRWILYGLGNFVFLSDGRYTEKNWFPYSFAAKLIVKNHLGNLEKHLRLYPLFSDNRQTTYQPRPLKPDEFKKFQQLLIKRSPLTSEQLREIFLGQDFFGYFLQFHMVDKKSIKNDQ